MKTIYYALHDKTKDITNEYSRVYLQSPICDNFASKVCDFAKSQGIKPEDVILQIFEKKNEWKDCWSEWLNGVEIKSGITV